MLIYCDSVILMYFFDHVGPFNVRATNRLAAMAIAKDQIAISDLVHLEYPAAAVEAGCDRFLTNVSRLSACTDIFIEALPP
jgi:hypothetical protein